jgi:hypothetical protein
MSVTYKSKIKDPHIRESICKMYAEGFSIHDIVNEYKTKYPSLNYKNIYRIIKSADLQKSIEKFRRVYLNNPLTVALANKKVRLEDLNRERLRIIGSIEKYAGKDSLIQKKNWSRYTTLVKRLIELEIAGRDEVEKKPDLFEAFGKLGPFADKTTEELRKYDREITIRLKAELQSGSAAGEIQGGGRIKEAGKG